LIDTLRASQEESGVGEFGSRLITTHAVLDVRVPHDCDGWNSRVVNGSTGAVYDTDRGLNECEGWHTL
jgi:hypothetical protein